MVDRPDDLDVEGTLRWAINYANGTTLHETINIATYVSQIELEDELPAITKPVTITYLNTNSRVTIKEKAGETVFNGLLVNVTSSGEPLVRFERLAFEDFHVGIKVQDNAAGLKVEIEDCEASDNGTGFLVAGAQFVTIEDCYVHENSGDGIHLQNVDPRPGFTPVSTAKVLDSEVTLNGGDGIVFANCYETAVTRSESTWNGENGVLLYSTDQSGESLQHFMAGNTVSYNSDAGIYVNAENGGIINNVTIYPPYSTDPIAEYSPSIITHNGEQGVKVRSYGWCMDAQGTHYSSISTVRIQGKGAYEDDGGVPTPNVVANNISNNGEEGVLLIAGYRADMTGVEILSNVVTDNGKEGIHVESTSDSARESTITDVTVGSIAFADTNWINDISDNGAISGGGIEFTADENSTISDVIVLASEVLSNDGDGIAFSNCDDAYVSNTTVKQNDVDGIVFTNCVESEASGNTVEDNVGDGIVFTNCNDACAFYNTVKQNDADGIVFANCDDACASYNTVTQNTANGIVLEALGYGETINLAQLIGNSVTENGEAGIYVNAEDGGTIDDVTIQPEYTGVPQSSWDSSITSNTGPGIEIRSSAAIRMRRKITTRRFPTSTYWASMPTTAAVMFH